MKNTYVISSIQTSIVIRILLFLEVFVVLGLGFFWITFRGDFIQNENLFDLISLLVPFIMIILAKSSWINEKWQPIVQRAQPWLHLIIMILAGGFLFLFQFTNWIEFPISFSWTYGIWWLLVSLVTFTAVSNEFISPRTHEVFKIKNNFITFSLGIFIGWILIVGLFYLSLNFAIILITIFLIHFRCLIYFIKQSLAENHDFSREISQATESQQKYHYRLSKFTSALLLIQLLIAIFYKIFDINQFTSIEQNWDLVVGFIGHWSLFLGMGLGLLGVYLEFTTKKPYLLFTEVLICGLILLGLFGYFKFAAFIFGFTIVWLFFLETNAKPWKYGISGWVMLIVWIGGLLGGNFYGIFHEFRAIFVDAFVILTILLTSILVLLRHQKRYQKEEEENLNV